jgi:hypothetical protein
MVGRGAGTSLARRSQRTFGGDVHCVGLQVIESPPDP